MTKSEIEKIAIAVGENIRRARVRAGLTQEQLAKAVGVTRPQITNLEGGRSNTTVPILLRIAKACHMRPSALLP
jgi:transcriptional regulator with XRE-family HTH domain